MESLGCLVVLSGDTLEVLSASEQLLDLLAGATGDITKDAAGAADAVMADLGVRLERGGAAVWLQAGGRGGIATNVAGGAAIEWGPATAMRTCAKAAGAGARSFLLEGRRWRALERVIAGGVIEPERVDVTTSMSDVAECWRVEEERLLALQREEATQRRRADEAEELRRRQEAFIDMVCHEMRNPLNGITNNNEFTVEAMEDLKQWLEARIPLDDAFNEAFARANQTTSAIALCAKHMKNITDDVINLSKIGLNIMKVSADAFNPRVLCEEVMTTVGAEMSRKGIASSVVVGERYLHHAADTYYGDPARLSQVIVNLVTNAVKFTEGVEERPRRVDVFLDLLDLDGEPEAVDGLTRRRLFIEVKDTGCGMDAEEKARLFTVFGQAAVRQLNLATKKTYSQYGGSGLGLFISKKIVGLMNGTIDVETEKNNGCKFTVTVDCTSRSIPVPQTTSTTALPPLLKSTSVPPGVSDSRRILIVDDNEINREILAKHLNKMGHRTQSAADGLRAVDLLRNGYALYKLVLMDLEMPIMDGRSATIEIRRLEVGQGIDAPMPIVAVTGNAREGQVERALEAGMDDVLLKPFTRSGLTEVVERYCRVPSPRPTPAFPSGMDEFAGKSSNMMRIAEGG
ncbi:CnHHK4 protein [Irineochytrium annulatum]|nr:CnHHK4 protein [Irineochytrium annulatum]